MEENFIEEKRKKYHPSSIPQTSRSGESNKQPL